MISMEHNPGGEVSAKLRELETLRKSEEVRTARRMAQVASMLDAELREARKMFREGEKLIEEGITLEALDAILRAFDGGDGNDA